MISGPFFVSPHAVRRCIERVTPRYTYEQALDFLIEASKHAHYVKPSTLGQGEVWRAPKRFKKIRMKIIHDPNREKPILATVLMQCDEEKRTK